jgi:hypothetical protein
MTPWWRRRSIVIPPESPEEWLRLAAWEVWMGMLLFLLIAMGTRLIVTAPDRIVAVLDLSQCYGAPPIPIPCERTFYRGGAMNVAFSALSGFVMLAVASWMAWALWNAAEPKPITDDFLRLLNDSFGRNWRNPLTWPWTRVFWAYGFTTIGAALTAGVAVLIWSVVSPDARAPAAKIETSQSFRAGQ